MVSDVAMTGDAGRRFGIEPLQVADMLEDVVRRIRNSEITVTDCVQSQENKNDDWQTEIINLRFVEKK
jgi:hypothetical protein